MQILNGKYQLCDHKAGSAFRELASYDQDFRKIAFGAVVDRHVEIHGSLEGVVHFDDKRGVDFFENVSLAYCIFELFFGDEFLLVEYFEGVDFIVLEIPSLVDFPERAVAKHFYDFKLFETNRDLFVFFEL